MQKHFFLWLLCIGFCFYSKAQYSKFEYGFQGGINVSSAYGKGVIKDAKEAVIGLSAGGQIKINTSEHFGIKALLSYDEYGWAYRSQVYETNLFDGSTTDVTYKLSYLNLLVLAEYSFGHTIKINVNGGAFVGILLHNETTTQINFSTGTSKSSKTTPDYRSKLNFGLALGTGVQIPIAKKIAAEINVRNSTGLTNVNGPNSFKTSAFTFLGGLTFKM